MVDIGDFVAVYGAIVATGLAIREVRNSRVVLHMKCEERMQGDEGDHRPGKGNNYDFTITNDGPRPVAIRESGLLLSDNWGSRHLDRAPYTLQPGEIHRYSRRGSEVAGQLEGRQEQIVGLYVARSNGEEHRFREAKDISAFDVSGLVIPAQFMRMRAGDGSEDWEFNEDDSDPHE